MKRKLGWGAVWVPWVRDELVRVEEAVVARCGQMQARARAVGRGDLEAEIGRQAAEASRMAGALPGAHLLWVSADMARVALDAARDIPAYDVAAAPAPVGMVLFAQPMPPIPTEIIGGLTLADGTEHTEPVPVDGITWQVRGEALRVDVLCRDRHLPGPIARAPQPPARIEPFLGGTLPAACDLDALVPAGRQWTGQVARGAAPEAVAAVALLAALWHLSELPTLAKRRVIDARTGAEPTAPPRPHDPLHVTCVDLRPLPRRDAAPTGQGRPLTHRHVVRGHWTHQPHGPGNSLRKILYVEPYIRGPEGAPLVDSETVMVWRR